MTCSKVFLTLMNCRLCSDYSHVTVLLLLLDFLADPVIQYNSSHSAVLCPSSTRNSEPPVQSHSISCYQSFRDWSCSCCWTINNLLSVLIKLFIDLAHFVWMFNCIEFPKAEHGPSCGVVNSCGKPACHKNHFSVMDGCLVTEWKDN